jgi:uncharacterized protein (DUF983 family)
LSILPSPYATGLGERCPACGEGRLFQGFLTVVDHCAICGADLREQDSGDGPVAFITLIAGAIVVMAALVVEVKYGWPVWLHMTVWLPLAAALSVGPMRPLKGLMIALQYKHRRSDFERQG